MRVAAATRCYTGVLLQRRVAAAAHCSLLQRRVAHSSSGALQEKRVARATRRKSRALQEPRVYESPTPPTGFSEEEIASASV